METNIAPSPIELETLREKFRTDIQPFITAKLIIYQIAAPKIVIFPNGEISYEFSEKEQAVLDQCDKGIADAAKRYGVSINGEDRNG